MKAMTYSPQSLEAYMTAASGRKGRPGGAIMTLKRASTGARITYRITKCKPKDGQEAGQAPWLVEVLTGSSITTDYTTLGYLWKQDGLGCTRYVRPQWSPIGEDAPSAKAMKWLRDRVEYGRELPADVEVWSDGRCSKCRKLLSVPESVAAGMGPDCRKAA